MSIKETSTKILLVCMTILLAGFVWMTTNLQVDAKDENKWQYYTYEGSTSGPTEKILNDLGNEGWELVAIDSKLSTGDALRAPKYVFKRPKK